MKRGLIGALAAASLLLGTVSPASAEVTAGAGAGTGGDYPESVTPQPCGLNPTAAEVDGYRLEIDHIGTYSGVDNDTNTPVVYVGDTHVTVEAVDPFWFSPLGTHNPSVDPTCLVPLPIPIEATVTGNTGTGSVVCEDSPGLYTRVQSAVVIEFTGECTVDGNTLGFEGKAESDATHVLEGTLTPCTFPPFDEDNPNPACTADPSPLPPFPTDGPGSVYVGTYEVAGT
jgi:hypothetical protein